MQHFSDEGAIRSIIRCANWPQKRSGANLNCKASFLKHCKSFHPRYRIRKGQNSKNFINNYAFSHHFASSSVYTSPQRRHNGAYLAILGLGSNIAPEIWRFKKLLARCRSDSRISILSTSAFVINAAFGFEQQKDFTNAAILVRTSLPPRRLLAWALHEERVFHRRRSFKNAPRTLDIDLLYVSAPIRQCERLRLPHPGAHERLSVALPISFL